VPRFTAVELLVVSSLLLLGVAGRVAYPQRISVEHFDEGVYANDTWFANGYVSHELYAPPLLPKLIHLSVLFFPATSYGPAVPNLLAGCATLLLAWWLSRSWLGPVAGLVTLTAGAVCQLHAAFSRTALTDPMFTWWVAVALFFAERWMRTDRWLHVVGLGLAAGLAWWTKYNGWFPLAVAAASVVALGAFPVTRDGTIRRGVGVLVATVIAAMVWLPVWWSLPNGYRPIAENHARYLVGVGGWWGSAWRQIQQLAIFDGGWPLVIGLAGCAAVAADALRAAREQRRNDLVARVVLLIWLGSLTLAIPLYTPYARLLLPWSVATWLVAGGLWAGRSRMGPPSAQLATETPARMRANEVPRWRRATQGGVLLLAGMLGVGHLATWGWLPFENRGGLSEAAERILSDLLRARVPVNSFRAYGEPALTYQFFARDAVTLPLGDLELARSTSPAARQLVFLIGPHAESDPEFQKAWAEYQARFELLQEVAVPRSWLVRLDTESTAELRRQPQRRITIRVYRLASTVREVSDSPRLR
jgi:hypothetical protein